MTPESGLRPAALITGGSSGIGRELAGLFAADGHELVLVARGRKRLLAIAGELETRHGIRAHALAADLANADAPDRIAAEVERLGLAVDHLVNNAGFTVFGSFLETDGAAERDMIRVQVEALTALTKRIASGMAARGHGRILNLASTAAFQPGPLMAVYYATKAYVLSFSVALAVELEGTGVTVTALCPGPTRTEFAEKAGLEETPLFRHATLADPRAVARAGYRGMLRGERIVVPGLLHKTHAVAIRLAPRELAARVVRFLHAGRG